MFLKVEWKEINEDKRTTILQSFNPSLCLWEFYLFCGTVGKFVNTQHSEILDHNKKICCLNYAINWKCTVYVCIMYKYRPLYIYFLYDIFSAETGFPLSLYEFTFKDEESIFNLILNLQSSFKLKVYFLKRSFQL